MAKHLAQKALGTRTAEFNRDYWHIDVEPDISMADLMRPNFWAHHTSSLKLRDMVDVVATDMSLDATFRVVSVGVGYVELRPMRVYLSEERQQTGHDEPEAEGTTDLVVPEGYVVNHAPKTGWRVLTKDPHAEVSRNHKSRAEATIAAIAHAAKANGIAA